MNVQVATEANFRAWQGFDLALWDSSDEEDETAPRLMRFLKTTSITDFTKQVAETLKLDPELVRPWVIVNRQNGTKRPDQPIDYPSMTLEEASAKFATRAQYFKVFIEETTRDADNKPQWGPEIAANAPAEKKPIIIFLKHFDLEKQELRGVGHTYMTQADRVQDLATPILETMRWPAGTSLRLYEEIKPSFVEVMKPKQTLGQSEIQDGDIICFQRSLTEKEVQSIQQNSPSAYLEAPQFYDYLLNRITVFFGSKPGAVQNLDTENSDDRFSLFLSRKDTYDQLALKVAEHLSKTSKSAVNPTHLRFSTVHAQTAKPKTVVKRTPTTTMHSILSGVGSGGYGGYGGYANQSQDSLYYEVLEMSLADLEQRKNIKVTWLSEGVVKEVSGFNTDKTQMIY